MQTKPVSFVEDSRLALQELRRTLIELFAAIEADPSAPQEVARRFGINRNLTWKLSKVMTAHDPFASLNYIPGEQGILLALDAFAKAGASRERVENVSAAVRRFRQVIGTHADDREQFELTLESMGLFEREGRPEGGREQAYRGNSMVWGVHARTRLASMFLAPGDAPGTVDFVLIAGLLGFRRLRPNAKWRLFRSQLHDDKGGSLRMRPDPLDLAVRSDVPHLLPSFCSENMPEIEVLTGADGIEYMLPGGPVGKQAAFDVFMGYIARGLPLYRDETNQYGSGAAPITLPTESLVFDVLAHRDVALQVKPEVLLYGYPHGGTESPAAQTLHNRLPCNERAVELAGPPPAVATPAVPRYSRLAEFVYERMGWRPAEFTGLRVTMPFPPMSSRVVLRWPLPEKPA
ncbi:MAG: hypothetical protein FJ255_05815 [Phycisphaerae bacterium]|nr:hypothetical protein [Phycisphaerae bacterium]